jgi:TIR domain
VLSTLSRPIATRRGPRALGDRTIHFASFSVTQVPIKGRVRQLSAQLRKVGIDPWLDEEKLLPGQDWRMEIARALRDTHAVVVCLSQQSVTRAGYVQKEIVSALDIADEQPEGAIFIVPVKLEECDVPQRLSRWHWVHLDEKGFDRLVDTLTKRAESLGIQW